MSKIKSYSVGNGDMFYINHNSDNFSIIDCFLSEDNKERIVKDIKLAMAGKTVTRFISTHPDEDHFQGLKYLDQHIGILNFYCVKNETAKKDETEDFKHYKNLKDSNKTFHIFKGCQRKWMNLGDEQRDGSGLDIIWPITDNPHHIKAHSLSKQGESPNNTSAVIHYTLEGGASFLWMGDLETDFMDKISKEIEWPKVDIIFAPHHGRDSGKIPNSILDQLKPKIIIIGEAPSRHLNYYGGYHTITQNSAGDIIFDCQSGKVNIFVSEPTCKDNFLDNEYVVGNMDGYYIGTLNV